jgi:hypothetical protein
MANDEHVALLKQGVAAWNAWRDANANILPDLSGADLSEAILIEANLIEEPVASSQRSIEWTVDSARGGRYYSRHVLAYPPDASHDGPARRRRRPAADSQRA